MRCPRCNEDATVRVSVTDEREMATVCVVCEFLREQARDRIRDAVIERAAKEPHKESKREHPQIET